jgi:hypothetical protein
MRFNFPTMVKRMEETLKLRKKGMFMPVPSGNTLGPDGKPMPPKGGISQGTKGGRPSGQPQKANQQKLGKPQPKKATAKLIEAGDGITCYMVVGADEMDHEEREIVSEKFGIPTEWVLTQAEYEHVTGKTMSWLPPLPNLSTAAAWVAMRHAQRVEMDIKAEAENEIAAIKATGTGKRGKYVTDKLVAETMERVTASFIQKMRPEGVSAEEWSERKNIVTEALQAEAGDKPEGDLRVMAACTLLAQYLMRASRG